MSGLFLFHFRDAYHVSTHTVDAQCLLQSVQAILIHCAPSEGRGWKQTAQINTHTPPFSFVLCPMTQSHTSWKIYTETLANFEAKFLNTYLFWVNLLFESTSFFFESTPNVQTMEQSMKSITFCSSLLCKRPKKLTYISRKLWVL